MITRPLLPSLLKPGFLGESLLMLGFLLFFSSAGIHGFSLPMWHDFIDNTPHAEVLWGKARGVRSDDWAVTLPMAIGQAVANPRFPVENPNIGQGQNMLLLGRIPAGSWQLLARPETWGFLVGVDFGLAWAWWLPILALFWFAFRFAMRHSNKCAWFSLSAAVLLCFSPFFQFWSFNTALPFALALCCLEIFDHLLRSRRLSFALLWGALLGYCGSIFIMSGYPPVLVALGYFTLAAASAQFKRDEQQLNIVNIAAGLATGIAVCGLLVGNIMFQSLPAIEAMRHTEYPGQRSNLAGEGGGGGIPLSRIFSNLIFASKNVAHWDVLGNVCEAAAFPYLFPIMLLAWFWSGDRSRAKSVIVYTTGISLILMWMTVGLPEFFAKATLLQMLPPTRGHAALGMFDWSLTVLILGSMQHTKLSRKWLVIGATLWGLLLFSAAKDLWDIAGVAPLRMAALGSGWLIVAWLILRGRKWAICIAAAMTASMTGHFNPVVVGGGAYLFENPLAQAMTAISQKYPGEKWVVVRDQEVLGNYPRLIGLPGLNGTHFTPQMSLWRGFDSDGSQAKAYNRYARVVVDTRLGASPHFEVPKPDSFTLVVDPRHEGFRRAGGTLYLVTDPASEFSGEDFDRLGTVVGKSIYRLKPKNMDSEPNYSQPPASNETGSINHGSESLPDAADNH